MTSSNAPGPYRPTMALRGTSSGLQLASLLFCFSLPVSGLAATKIQSPSAAYALHQKGQYAEAAARGLRDLLAQPWSHELRLLVADSLRRAGKIDEAAVQLEALEGTALADTAHVRLLELRKLANAHAVGSPLQTPSAPPPVAVPALTLLPATVMATAAPAAAASGVAPVVQVPVAATPPVGAQALSAQLSTGASITTPSGGAIQLAPFQYIPPAGARPVDAADAPQRSPELQRLVDLNAAGDYQTVGTEGLTLKLDDELTLMVANSLAWTGRLKQASQTYQGLMQGKYAQEARMGQAHIHRWTGLDHLAAPVYRAVLLVNPDSTDALEGLKLAERELRPRTMFSLGGSGDSSDIQRRSATVNHRWRDSGGANIWEVETSAVQDSLRPLQVNQQDLTVRYKALDRAFKPRLELSTEGHSVYGKVGVALGGLPVLLDAGRVNWGRMATNPRGLAAHLAATHLGLGVSEAVSLGSLAGRVDYYDVSDGNTVLTSTLRFSPAWRPLGPRIKPLLGIETRDAKFNTNHYWSPAQGYGSAYAGLLAEWGGADWNVFASGQLGAPLYGEAGNSWSVTAGGKRWLSSNWAIGTNFWAMSSRRDNAPYRAHSLVVNIEKLWE